MRIKELETSAPQIVEGAYLRDILDQPRALAATLERLERIAPGVTALADDLIPPSDLPIVEIGACLADPPSPTGGDTLLIIENRDQPGMISYVGTLLGKDKVNIANMSLSRQEAGQTALMVINLDSEPSEAARRELKAHKAIRLAKFVHL